MELSPMRLPHINEISENALFSAYVYQYSISECGIYDPKEFVNNSCSQIGGSSRKQVFHIAK